MSLIGTRLGAYEVTALVGAGGMGEVYRAIDTDLKRAVAIKVLPDSRTFDADRLARFQREAEILASLNHPHIAHVHGLARREGLAGIVMELVEGPTLAERILDGPLVLDEALSIARQIAEALEAAHERGVIHRDLKPANIKVRADGTVKVLDFGLAKLSDSDAPAGPRHPSASLASTITAPAMTEAGTVLGTAAYMAPEQITGAPVDRRADIWAFGCVLYEMLTGRRAFEGATAPETFAAVFSGGPDWTRLPDAVPPAVRALLRRCLAREPRHRLSHMAAVLFALEGENDRPSADLRGWRGGDRPYAARP